MDSESSTPPNVRGVRGRGGIGRESRGRPLSRNQHWSAAEGSRSQSYTPNNTDNERWERGGHRGGSRGRGNLRGTTPRFSNVSLRLDNTRQPQHVPQHVVATSQNDEAMNGEDSLNVDQEMDQEEEDIHEHTIQEPELITQDEREKFYQELVKARELERKKAISEGKMDDPLVPKRLEDAITIVGTCTDMCPRFERYRRERENNLFEWETIPGTRRVDHNRAVKMYERGAGDRVLPSDLRPPHVLKRTLDYLFHDLIPRGGFSPTFNFIRDRSRAVRNDFSMQHIENAVAVESHDRCVRFHILAMHFQRDDPSFSIPLEEQQLMNTLQTLKQFYEDQRRTLESPTELEMRVYHRLIHIRDQKERHDDIPEHIQSHPVFQLTTDFRQHVQKHSAPISKTSELVVTHEGMQIFSNLAAVLMEQGNAIMVYLVACILERLFGKDTIEDIESLRGSLTIPEIIDGAVTTVQREVDDEVDHMSQPEEDIATTSEVQNEDGQIDESQPAPIAPMPLKPTSSQWLSNGSSGPSPPAPASTTPATGGAFATLVSQHNAFGTTNIFGTSFFPVSTPKPATPNFGEASSSQSVFGSSSTPTSTGAFGSSMENNHTSLTNNLTSDFADGTPLPNTIPATESTINQQPFMPNIPPPSNLNPKAQEFTPLKYVTHDVSPPPAPVAVPPTSTTPAPSLTTSVSSDHSSSKMSSTDHPTSVTTEVGPPTGLSKSRSNRPTPPPLVMDSTASLDSPSKPSPALPPTPKIQPVSLPSTPSFPLKSHLRSALQIPNFPFRNSNKEMLSPLLVGTPTASQEFPLRNFTPLSTPQHSQIFQKPRISPTTPSEGKEKALDKSLYDDVQMVEDMKKKGFAFLQRSLLVKQTFNRWLKRTMDRAAWHEACQRGDNYRQKLNPSRHSSVVSSTPRPATPPKRRLGISANSFEISPPKKRSRKHFVADYRPPRTDEDLAKRFKENLQDHEQRWARGSFLKVLRNHIQFTDSSTMQLPWDIWLSLNPESDATAIWLERKFDMPESGSWFSETVFRIPLAPSRTSNEPGFPGLIVFECTPVGDVVDELEKKFRVLDDCSRLRNTMAALPTKRHFVPTLLVIHWAESESSVAPDFLSMAKQFESEAKIQSCHVFSITAASKELDLRLQNIIPSLQLDTEGKLVQSLNPKSLFRIFEPTFTTFFNEWMENLTSRHSNWNLYREIITASISVLDLVSHLVHSLLKSPHPLEKFPNFDHSQINDSSSAFDRIFEWLASFTLRDDAKMIAMDLQSHRNMGQEFPLRVFIDLLYRLIQLRIERLDRSFHPILVSDLDTALESLKNELQPYQLRLLQVFNFSVRRSPKRRTYSVASSEQSSPDAKRPRLTSPLASSYNGDDFTPMLNGHDLGSPTPSMSTLGRMEAPTVTVSMLRTLTKDLRKKYIIS